MNTFLAFRLLRYYMFSRHKNGHGIHSPFVYSLIRNVFKNKTDSSIVSLVESSRKRFRSDHRLIPVTDLGSGSLKINSRQRKVSDIARYASVRPAYGKLLVKLAALADGKDIIELGTSLGLGTLCLALGAPASRVFTIEGCSNTAALAGENFRQLGVDNIKLKVADFDDALVDILEEIGKPGLVYIDGNHRSEALLRYLAMVEPFVDEDTIIIIDDIHYSRDMEKGWERVKQTDFVVLSVDLGQLGLLFFRKGIKKQDFVIRY